ncbi:MAG: response regulator transcription factor [Gammaproteobacteria bacterium]|nr:response regulator transcription factor [Gammaproteobacteria bacterium]
MSRLRTIIVDDESLARDLLQSHLAQFKEIEVVAECRNGDQAIKAINKLRPDLLFLDIQMPGLNGLDVIKRVPENQLPLVVFATAYDQFALKAFDIHAVDYLLKPIDAAMVGRSVQRALSRAKQGQTRGVDSSLQDAIRAIDQAKSEASQTSHANARTDDPPSDKLIIRDRKKITLLPHSDIDWIEAAGDYMCIHAAGQTHILRSTMKMLQSQLNDPCFQRVHRSTIVNLQRIEHIEPLPKGEYFLQLSSADRIKVSRNYRSVIKALLKQD